MRPRLELKTRPRFRTAGLSLAMEWLMRGILKGALLIDWFGIICMRTDKFCFYLHNRLIQTSQTGGQQYSDTSPFSIPWLMYIIGLPTNLPRKNTLAYYAAASVTNIKKVFFSKSSGLRYKTFTDVIGGEVS